MSLAPRSGRVLVTGAAGMLGHQVAIHLIQAGDAVVTASRRPSRLDATHVQADLTDSAAVGRIFEAGPIHAVLHLAAIIPGAPGAGADFSANLLMTRNLLEGAARAGARRFVLASSVAVYGMQAGPCAEECKTLGAGPYAEGKLAEEALLREFHQRHGLSSCALRIAAPYGGGASARTVVDRFLAQALAGEPLKLFGTGVRQQHFVHKADVARAFGLALHSTAEGEFNVSGPAPVSMLELAQHCVAAAASQSPIQLSGEDPQESYRGNFPWKQASAAFGYQPGIALDQGLRLMIEELRSAVA